MPEPKPVTPRSKPVPAAPKPASKAAPKSAPKSARKKGSGHSSTPPPVYPARNYLDELRGFLRRNGRTLAAWGFILLGIVMLAGMLLWDSPTWAERLFGWTTALMAAALIILGAVMLAGRRAGYWSAEALVGAELLLLSLQATTYIIRTPGSTEPDAVHGAGGGMVGWALGTVLVQAIGRTLSLTLLFAMAVLGIVGLIRYTPLVFPAMAAVRWATYLYLRATNWWSRRSAYDPAAEGELPASANFVSPVAPEPGEPANSSAHKAASTSRTAPPDQPPLSDASTVAAGKAAKPQPRKRPETVTAGRVDVSALGLPPRDLLVSDLGVYASADVDSTADDIVQTLEDLGVPVKVVHTEPGPTVTQFGVEPLFVERAGQRRKVRVASIVSMADDLALALAVPAVRIEAPVPGRPYVGIEVPNREKALVTLRGIMDSAEMHEGGLELALPLGRYTSGAPVVLDLTRAPHMLIAGATGSGKSVCINTIITGLLMRHSPQSLRFVMVDPKRVELTGYNGIPHLLGSVISDVDKVMPALLWLLIQMDDRYRLFRETGVRNITAFNALAASRKPGEPPLPPLPYIVLIVDELADLMMTAPEDIERQLCRLAQMARATGIHLILATQRPSVDVVTGLIKANFPTRISFAVSSQIDSRVILDSPGAERLLGRGDMLLSRPDFAKLLRVQGCLVTDEEITRVASFWRDQRATEYAAEYATGFDASADAPDANARVPDPWAGLTAGGDGDDELMQKATEMLQGMTTCSISLLQRKLRIGYPRAARLMDDLEDRGIVGPDMGAGQGREVLIPADPPANSAGHAEDNLFEFMG